MATTSPHVPRVRGIARNFVHGLAGKLDWVLAAAVGVVAVFGLRMVAFATRDDVPGDPGFFATRQLVYTLLGVGVMAVAIATDIEALSARMWALWGALIGAVAVVLVIGTAAKGASRWIDFGIFQFQPSEIGKVALIIILAALICERHPDVGTVNFTLLAAGVAAVPIFVVFLQPDLGTSLVYVAIFASMMYFAGTPSVQFRWAAAGALAIAAIVLWVLPLVGLTVLHDYQMARLTTFIDSNADPGSAGWQVNQARTAVGHGGAFGQGVNGSTQVENGLLPEHQTDFIFASAAEMFGFVGMVALLAVFAVIIWRVIRIARRAATPFDQLVAGGIAAMFVFQIVVNIGMNVAILPVVGIPLPFMSYGGTHTLTNFIAVGLLMRIHRRSAKLAVS